MNKMNVQIEKPDWLDTEKYPFKNNFFETEIGQMHYVDEGQGDPIVMVHGNPGWSFEYREVIKAVSDKNRCIAPDLIGFGLSDKPYEFDYLPQSQASLFEEFMESLDLKNITLIVNDWGGPIGFNYAIKNPERISKIIILNTFMWPVKGDPHFEKFSGFMGKGIGKWMIKNFNFFGKAVVKKAVGDKSKLDKITHKHYYAHMTTPKERKGSWVFPGQIIGSSTWLDSLWQQRSQIAHIPTSIIWGMKDIAFRPKELEKFLSIWPDAEVTKLPEVGHFPQEESPITIIKELNK